MKPFTEVPGTDGESGTQRGEGILCWLVAEAGTEPRSLGQGHCPTGTARAFVQVFGPWKWCMLPCLCAALSAGLIKATLHGQSACPWRTFLC